MYRIIVRHVLGGKGMLSENKGATCFEHFQNFFGLLSSIKNACMTSELCISLFKFGKIRG